MCDPVRWRAYQLLRVHGPLRARQLAQSVGTSEATMMRNLQEMDRVGFITSVDDGSGKQLRFRPWRAIQGGMRLTGLETDFDQDTMARWMRVYVETQMVLLREWADQENGWSDEWREAVLNYDYWLRLTRDEVSALTDELVTVCQKYASMAHSREDIPDAEAIVVTTNVFPIKKPRDS